MKTLLAFAFAICTVAAHAAIPDYKAFRGTGGIIVASNPPNGTIVIDGSAIVAGTSDALTTNVTSLSASNATSKPVLRGVVNRTAELFGLEPGNANILVGPLGGTNLAISGLSTVTKNSGAPVGSQQWLNFIEGGNISFTMLNDPGAGRIDITVAAAGAGAAALTNNETRNVKLLGELSVTNGAITLGQSGFPITFGGDQNGFLWTNWYQLYAKSGITMDTVGAQLSLIGTNTLNLSGTSSLNLDSTTTLSAGGDILVPWNVAAASTVTAANGPNLIFNLGSHTNLNFVPLSGAGASNSISTTVAFTQGAAGGFFVTNNGVNVPVNTNANTTTTVSFWIANGATNFSSSAVFIATAPGTNIFRSESLFTHTISAPTNTASFTLGTNDFVLNQYYTNTAQRGWAFCTINMTNILGGDVSKVSLFLDQDGDGTWEMQGISCRLNGVALMAGSEELSAALQPNARFLFTNQTTGTAAATINANSSQWVKQ